MRRYILDRVLKVDDGYHLPGLIPTILSPYGAKPGFENIDKGGVVL